MSSFWSDNLPKLGQMFGAIAVFLAVLAVIFYIAGRANGKAQRPVAILVFLGPALLLLLFGLLGPAIRTFLLSFKGSASHSWVGFRNYQWLFTDETMRIVLRNTVFWILFTPIITTGLGLLLAILLDRMRRESVAKSLIFMPMAISFVGASIVWQFVYKYANPNQPQVGLMSSIARHLGFEPTNWLLTQPMNTFLLMIVFVWSQTGFAMVILSAAIKNVPADIMEASALDGATGWRLFRGVTFPMVRSTFIVVLATLTLCGHLLEVTSGLQFSLMKCTRKPSFVTTQVVELLWRSSSSSLSCQSCPITFITYVGSGQSHEPVNT
jgi:alpha-glucoside transport system permease protein